jgi:hypothetical protein
MFDRRARTRALAVLLAVGAIAGAPAAAAEPAPTPPLAVSAKTCSAGWKHAVIGGAEKCLRRGQFCARRYKRQYRRHGFRCVPSDYGYRLR